MYFNKNNRDISEFCDPKFLKSQLGNSKQDKTKWPAGPTKLTTHAHDMLSEISAPFHLHRP